MAEGGDLHHESRAKWPINADDYDLEEVIGKKSSVPDPKEIHPCRSRCNGGGSSCDSKENQRTCGCQTD